jgi:agmatine deiminase
MKLLNSFLCFAILTAFCSCNHESKTEFYLPGEWEAQNGLIAGGLDEAASFEMVTQLSKEEKVYCTVADSMKANFIKKLSDAGANLDSINFITSSVDFWYAMRDGIMFIKNMHGEKRILNFQWNAYGWYFVPESKSFMEADKISREAYTKALCNAFPYPVISSSMVNEGGAIEINGKGTVLQVESVNMQRNPNMTKESQETELKRVLNAKKIIWLKEGAADDPFGKGALITENYFGIGVSGHLDEFCRFVNEHTILIAFPDSAEAAIDPVKKIMLERMKVNYDILKNATDQDGKPFTIVKMPVPDNEYMTFALDTKTENEEISSLSKNIIWGQKNFKVGDTVHFVPSSSYLNFLITNKTVFEAKYWTEGKSESSKAKDEKAKQILQLYFPDRKIYQINTVETNYNGGGLHCWSMQVPR